MTSPCCQIRFHRMVTRTFFPAGIVTAVLCSREIDCFHAAEYFVVRAASIFPRTDASDGFFASGRFPDPNDLTPAHVYCQRLPGPWCAAGRNAAWACPLYHCTSTTTLYFPNRPRMELAPVSAA